MILSDAIKSAGYQPPEHIIAGQVTRFSTNGKLSDKAGWVYPFSDGLGAAFGDHRTDEKHHWQADRDQPLSKTEQEKVKQECQIADAERKRQREADYLKAANQARFEWEAASLADALHPYIQRKGIKPNFARIDTQGNLLIPVYDLVGQIQSLQRIFPGGDKRFFSGGKMVGGHCWLGSPENGATLLICEGWATGDTLSRATGYAVCVCFSAGNLLSVTVTLKQRYSTAILIVAGDDDLEKQVNIGRLKAIEAAQAVSGAAVFAKGGGDFNDLEKSSGLAAVRKHFERLQLPVVHKLFNVPGLVGTDARDGTTDSRPLSELGNSQRLYDAHGTELRYVQDAKAWLCWRYGAWLWDVNGATIRRLAANLSEKIYSEGSNHLAEAQHFAKWSRTSQKEQTILASVSLLQDFEPVRLPLALVDCDLFKVGFDHARQVIDLRTGNARPVTQGDLITKSLTINCLGNAAKALRWEAFLQQIFNNDVELIDWLKRWCGYMLTGVTSEQILIFCFGLGANGKSVFGDILRYILGDYARAIASETLTEAKRAAGSATPDLAELIGARMAISSETEDGQALAESLIKSLVSGDTMSVRKLHQAPVQFTPQFKLMILGNHKPVIKGNDHGIWRRIRLIPFLRTFKSEERDASLMDKLKAEAPHILAWMVDGCLDWQQQGLRDIPVIVQQATGDYQDEQDLIGNWLSECCDLSPRIESSSTLLYSSYKEWCLNNGLRPNSHVALSRRLSERGFNSRKSNGIRLWAGLSNRNPTHPTDCKAVSDW